jgi:hypothetical protein
MKETTLAIAMVEEQHYAEMYVKRETIERLLAVDAKTGTELQMKVAALGRMLDEL